MKTIILPSLALAMLLLNTACKKEVKIENTTTGNETSTTGTSGDAMDNTDNVAYDNQSSTATSAANLALPAAATALLGQHFNGIAIAEAKEKSVAGIGGKSYKVKLNNGVEIAFDANGNWEEIDGNKQKLPDALIPVGVKNYVAKNYAGAFVTSLDKEKGNIKADLSNDIDLLFDANGSFLRKD